MLEIETKIETLPNKLFTIQNNMKYITLLKSHHFHEILSHDFTI